jgi:hypothetical protein
MRNNVIGPYLFEDATVTGDIYGYEGEQFRASCPYGNIFPVSAPPHSPVVFVLFWTGSFLTIE